METGEFGPDGKRRHAFVSRAALKPEENEEEILFEVALKMRDLADAGAYSVVVTNTYGSVTSTPFTLTVSAPVPILPPWAWMALPILLLLVVAAPFTRKANVKYHGSGTPRPLPMRMQSTPSLGLSFCLPTPPFSTSFTLPAAIWQNRSGSFQ